MVTNERRKCSKCGLNRQLRFFTGPKGRVCVTCQRKARRASGHGLRTEKKYGITRAEYNKMLLRQGKVCAICGGGRPYNLDVDHDHRIEERLGTRASIMGLLCRQCNRVLLPACYRNPEILRAAARYLEDPPARHVLGNPRRKFRKVR